ncbi:hypothetical protein L1049_021402 [Liquidambar formosana]|uniref:Pentatricopeptide repeat-containing protein n=1 Tax=Liquidambar formosana TaxID=63359 RepID=A0AAP0N7D1_LIQFO
MWTLRRASHHLKRQGYHFRTSKAFGAQLDIVINVMGDRSSICKPARWISGRVLSPKEFSQIQFTCENFPIGCRSFCSEVGGESSSVSDHLEDGFSDLCTHTSTDIIAETNAKEDGEELVSRPELSDDDITETCLNDLNLLDVGMGVSGEDSHKKRALELFNAIIAVSGKSIHSALNKWVEDGNNFVRAEIYMVIIKLQRRRLYWKALQLLEWLEATKRLDLREREYAFFLDLIAKSQGLQKAEEYMETIPKSFRGEVVYRTLLANCVKPINMKKADYVFIKMRELEFPLTVFACNQMILLYKMVNKRRIADVLLLMEKENVKPSLLTYNLLIDIKGESGDLMGMEQLVERMKAEGIEPDVDTHSTLAQHYLSRGLKDKAEAVLREIELGYQKGSHGARRALLDLYASLGKSDEVGRVWEACELNPKIDDCIAAIKAWGKLGKIEAAEAVFEKMLQTWGKLSSRHYSALLKVYVDHKQLSKGKELVKQMGDSGCWVGALTWDALVRLYVEAGDVEKAESILQKAAQQNRMRPLFNTYMIVMDQYAKRGDVHNTEKLFHRMRQCGYTGRLKPFELLIQSYINANAPAYGFRERMKAENVFPNKSFAAQLARANRF